MKTLSSVPSASGAMLWVARIRSIRLALDSLSADPAPALLILPSTRGALMLARQLSLARDCHIVAGPISSEPKWEFAPLLRSPMELAQSNCGRSTLPRTVISFPDQLVGNDLSFSWIPFLGARYSFSAIEALLVLRHRPRVFALRSCPQAGNFKLTEVFYADLLDAQTHLASLQALTRRLLAALESELATPPPDWLAARWLAVKSESHWRFMVREQLKDMECLLRLHLISPTCDRDRTGMAVAAVVERKKFMLGPVPS